LDNTGKTEFGHAKKMTSDDMDLDLNLDFLEIFELPIFQIE